MGAKPEQTPTPRKRLDSRLAAVLAGLIVIVGAFTAYLLLAPSSGTVPVAPAPKAAKPTPKHVPRAKPAPTPAPTRPKSTPSAAAERPETTKPVSPTDTVVSTAVTTNKSGSVIERLVMADGTTRSKIHPPAPVFKRTSDQVIALCLSTKPGQSMPPLPMLDKSLERDFVESLSEPIEILESDSPRVKEIKAQVMETRAYLKEEIKSGRTTLLEALQEHQRSMERTADAHTMALQEVRKIRQNGGPQSEVDEFVKAVNESFKARGIPEIDNSMPTESRRGK